MCTVGTCTQFLYLFHVNTSHGRSEFAGARPHDRDAALSHRRGDGHVSARLCALAGGLRNATRVSVGSKPMHVHLQQNDLLWLPTFSAPRASCSAVPCRRVLATQNVCLTLSLLHSLQTFLWAFVEPQTCPAFSSRIDFRAGASAISNCCNGTPYVT